MRTIIICNVIKSSIIAVLGFAAATAACRAHADDVQATLAIRDHKFEPAELTVPAGVKIKLSIENHDATPEEFESHELNREKVVVGNGTFADYAVVTEFPDGGALQRVPDANVTWTESALVKHKDKADEESPGR